MTRKSFSTALVLVVRLVISIPVVHSFVYKQQSLTIGQTIINILTDLIDFVDNNTSDTDSSLDKGAHSNFSAQQVGPDSTYDTLTEENTGGTSNVTLIDSESFEGAWPPTDWTETDGSAWNRESNQAYDGTYSMDYDGPEFGTSSGNLRTRNLGCSDADAIYVDFWYRDDDCDADDFLLQYYNGSGYNTISDLGSTSQENQWLRYQQKITDSQYFISEFKVRWRAKSVSSDENIWIDFVTITKETQSVDNYQLDLEVQWTNVDYTQPNEELHIYGGTMGAEDIAVDVWDGPSWQNLFSDLTSGWNNVTVSSYLTSSTFTIRFKGVIETSDAIQDNWNIDVTLLRVWES